MSGFVRLSLALMIVLVVGVSSNVHRKRDLRSGEASFKQNMARASKFRCSAPRPRSYVSLDLINESLSTEEYIMPQMTVLHRCDSHAGCCLQAAHLTCDMVHEEIVRLDFKIWNQFSKSERHLTVDVANHTKCACRNIYRW